MGSGFARKKEYVVETSTKVVERCMLMTTDPGDLVLDPTMGNAFKLSALEESLVEKLEKGGVIVGYTVQLRPDARPDEIRAWMVILVEGNQTREVIANLNLYREAMHSFLDLGFTFAIDDVGSGYSGLETIATLGASYLKIDMGLVRDVHQRRVGQQVIKAILDLANGAGATVIAEGVQSREEADALGELGLRYAQGYYYARPVDPYRPNALAQPRR